MMKLVEFLKFKPFPDGSLDLTKSSDIAMEIIGQFLDSDVRYSGTKFLIWFASDSDTTGGNLTTVLKEQNFITIINNLTDGRVTITKEQFFQLLTQWTQIYETRPKELLVTKVNDQFIFEPTYEPSKLRQLFDHLRNLC